jgi:hypothetical protein
VEGEQVTGRGFEINKRGVERFTQELQKEFDKHPIRLGVQTGLPELPDIAHGTTVTYNGPVIFGSADGAQLAWNNGAVRQSHNGESQQIAEGFEALANIVAEILRQLPATGLDEEDQALAVETGNELLAELIQPSPELGKVKRTAAMLRGVLAPLAIAAESGAAQAVTEWAKTAIEHLSRLIS